MKKMRKAKVTTALALAVVMLVAMTGLASATTYWISGTVTDEGSLVPSATVKVYADAGLTVLLAEGSTDGDGYYEISFEAASISEPPYVYAKKNDATGSDQSEFVQSFKYVSQVTIYKGNVELIPEFATIAIPVAAILGLLFFFNHRKRKKE